MDDACEGREWGGRTGSFCCTTSQSDALLRPIHSCHRHHSTPCDHFPSAIKTKLAFFFPSLHKTLPSWSISRSLKISPGFTPARVHLPMSSILSLMADIGTTASCAALDTAPLGSWLCPQYDWGKGGRVGTEPQHNRVKCSTCTTQSPEYLVGVSALFT